MAQEQPDEAVKPRRGRPPKSGKVIDWEAIRAAYELGAATIAELGRSFDVHPTTISKKSVAEGWLSEQTLRQVRTQTAAELLRTKPGTTGVTPADITTAAKANAEVIRKHRKLIDRARQTVETLQDQLHAAVENREALKDLIDNFGMPKAVAAVVAGAMSVANNVGIAKELATAMKTLVELERKAYNIIDGEAENPQDRPPIGEIDRANAADTYRRMLR